ncbi:hypothetical protein P7C70_g7783, partial [Phenoliferia sp. Uapishka_3]
MSEDNYKIYLNSDNLKVQLKNPFGSRQHITDILIKPNDEKIANDKVTPIKHLEMFEVWVQHPGFPNKTVGPFKPSGNAIISEVELVLYDLREERAENVISIGANPLKASGEAEPKPEEIKSDEGHYLRLVMKKPL